MKELLKIEYLKIKHYTVFRAFMLIFAAVIPLIFYAVSSFRFPGIPSQETMVGFPGVWSYLTYVAGWFNFLPGILVAALVCNEISYKTQKQNVIDGLSRMEVILSKFYVVLTLSVLITAYIFVVGLVFGVIYSGVTDVFSGVEELLFFFVQTLGFLSIALLLSVIIRKSSLSIIAYLIVFLFLGQILEGSVGENLSQWMPTNMLSDLTQFPLYAEVVNMERMVNPALAIDTGINHWILLLISLIYIAGFISLSYFVMKKRDL